MIKMKQQQHMFGYLSLGGLTNNSALVGEGHPRRSGLLADGVGKNDDFLRLLVENCDATVRRSKINTDDRSIFIERCHPI